MARQILVKTAQAVLTLCAALVVVFLGVRALPGDAAFALAGQEGSLENIEAVRELHGLDRHVAVQFVEYAGQVLRGDFGRSTSNGMPVADAIGRALPVTLELAFLAVLVASVVGIAFGVVAALRQGKPSELGVNTLALLALSIPNFWLGLMGVLLLGVIFPILPASGYTPFFEDPVDNLRRMIMPACVLGTALAAVIMRQTRSAMLETLSADFMRTARAKGLRRSRIIVRHGLRNSLMVVVTVIGLQLGALISGAVVTEQVFVIPGLGKLTLDAVFTRDYPMIQGVVLVVAFAYVTINLLTDILYTVIDPRIRVRAEVG